MRCLGLVVLASWGCSDPRPASPSPPPHPEATTPAGPCAGSHLDLDRLLEEPACTRPPAYDAPDIHKRTLDYRVASPAGPVKPGAVTDLVVTLTNTGPLPVDLIRLAGFHALVRNVDPAHQELGRVQLDLAPTHPGSRTAAAFWYGTIRLVPRGEARITFGVKATATVEEHQQFGSGSTTVLAWVPRTGDLPPGTYELDFAIDWNGDEDTFDGRAASSAPVTLTVVP